MPRKKTYSLSEAHQIMIESEGRKSPKSGEEGHTILQHVGGLEQQVGGRLKGGLDSSASAPIIIDPSTGRMATRKDTIDIYVSASLHPSKNKAGAAYDEAFTAPKATAGAFLDQQQAARALQFALNSTEGQTALGNLDAGSKREFFTVSVVSMATSGKKDAYKMYFATSLGGCGTDMSDLTHMADFTSVTVGIDLMPADEVHLQTLYPVK